MSPSSTTVYIYSHLLGPAKWAANRSERYSHNAFKKHFQVTWNKENNRQINNIKNNHQIMYYEMLWRSEHHECQCHQLKEDCVRRRPRYKADCCTLCWKPNCSVWSRQPEPTVTSMSGRWLPQHRRQSRAECLEEKEPNLHLTKIQHGNCVKIGRLIGV